jgi:hypothetical protein
MTTFDRLRKHLDGRPETRTLWREPPDNSLVSTVRFLCDLIDQQAARIDELEKRSDGALRFVPFGPEDPAKDSER